MQTVDVLNHILHPARTRLLVMGEFQSSAERDALAAAIMAKAAGRGWNGT